MAGWRRAGRAAVVVRLSLSLGPDRLQQAVGPKVPLSSSCSQKKCLRQSSFPSKNVALGLTWMAAIAKPTGGGWEGKDFRGG